MSLLPGALWLNTTVANTHQLQFMGGKLKENDMNDSPPCLVRGAAAQSLFPGTLSEGRGISGDVIVFHKGIRWLL